MADKIQPTGSSHNSLRTRLGRSHLCTHIYLKDCWELNSPGRCYLQTINDAKSTVEWQASRPPYTR